MKHFVLAAFLATPALADTPLTVDQFEAIVTGKTYTYASADTAPYGIETYGPNRQVIWAFFDDRCEEGIYYAGANDTICFFYPDSDHEECWTFFKQNGELAALSRFGTPYDITPTDQSVPCIGPLLGV